MAERALQNLSQTTQGKLRDPGFVNLPLQSPWAPPVLSRPSCLNASVLKHVADRKLAKPGECQFGLR